MILLIIIWSILKIILWIICGIIALIVLLTLIAVLILCFNIPNDHSYLSDEGNADESYLNNVNNQQS